MPFENESGKTEFNWIGDSFAITLANLANVLREADRPDLEAAVLVEAGTGDRHRHPHRPRALSARARARRVGLRVGLGLPPVRDDKLRAGGLPLEHRDRLETEALASRNVAERPHESGELGHRSPRRSLVERPERLDRHLVQLYGLRDVAAMHEDPGETRPSRRKRVLVVAGEIERSPVVRLGRLRVEVRSSISREEKKANEALHDVRPLVAGGELRRDVKPADEQGEAQHRQQDDLAALALPVAHGRHPR